MNKTLACIIVALSVSACSGLDLLDSVTPNGEMTAHKDIAFSDHERGKMDIYVPLAEGNDRPIVLWLYGGSWSSGDKDDYRFIAEWLTRENYVVAIPDYRLYPEVRFPEFLKDNAQALSWLSKRDNVDEFGADAACIIVMGHSAGAYNGAMLSYDNSWQDMVGIDGYPIKAFVGLAGPYDFYPFDIDLTRTIFGHVSDPRLTQPVNHVDRGDDVPALLLHGEDDETVLPRNSKSLAEHLWRRGAQAELKILEDIDHRSIVAALSSVLAKENIRNEIEDYMNRVTNLSCNGAVSLPVPLVEVSEE